MKRVQIIAVLFLACAVMESYQLLGFHRHKETDAICQAVQDRCLTRSESTKHKCKKIRKMSAVCHYNRKQAAPCMNTCLQSCDINDNVFPWARCLLKCEKSCPHHRARSFTPNSMSAETTCQWLSSQCTTSLSSAHQSWKQRSTEVCSAIEKDTGMCIQMMNQNPSARTCAATCLNTCNEHTGDFLRWKQCHKDHCLPCFTEHFRLNNPCDQVLRSCNDQASFAKPEDRIAAGLLCEEIKTGNYACNSRLDDPSFGFCREQCAQRCEGIHNAILTWGQCLKDHCGPCRDRYGKYSQDFNPVIEQQYGKDKTHDRDIKHHGGKHHGKHHGEGWIPEGRVIIPEEGPTRVQGHGHKKHDGLPGMMKEKKNRLNVCHRITEQCRIAAPLASEHLHVENWRFCNALERNLSDCRAGVRLPMKERCGQVCMSGCESLASQDFYKWRVCIENACGECLQEVGGNVYRETIPSQLGGEEINREPGMEIPQTQNIPQAPPFPHVLPQNTRDQPLPEHKRRKIGWFDRLKRPSWTDRYHVKRSHGSHKVYRNKDHLFRDRDHINRPVKDTQNVPDTYENIIRNNRARYNY